MKKLFLTLLLFLPIVCSAQLRVPDEEDITAKVFDKNSPYHLPDLLQRYYRNDTTLTADDYFYLYYGYAYAPTYKPMKAIDANDKILAVFSGGQEPDAEGMERLIDYAMEALDDDPFSPQNLNYLVYAYGALGDTINERIYYDKMQAILSVIDNSGTGKNVNSPKHILWFSHATDLLTSKGAEITDRQVVRRDVEYVYLKERDEDKQRGYYFNFGRIYRDAPEQSPERKRNWEFNNFKMR